MKILHLYPNLMNLYGDYGNVLALQKHLTDQGLFVTVDKKEIDELINFNDYDFVYMGSGTEENLKVALKDLKNYSKEFKRYISKNKLMLLTGNAMEVLASSIDGEPGLGVIDFKVKTYDKRYTGDVVVSNEEIGEIVGFINKSTLIEGAEDYKLFDYIFTDSNLIDNQFEGYRINNTFATHIIGPILIKNPCFMEYLIRYLVKDNYIEHAYIYDEEAYRTTLKELKRR